MRELQVWKYNNGIIENVALDGHAYATSTNPNHGPASCIINEIINDDSDTMWWSNYEANTVLGHYIELTLKDYVYIEDLASVVWYWFPEDSTSLPYRKNGITISLHDQNEEIFSRETSYTTPSPSQFRIDGPTITKTQKFSYYYSTTHIIDDLRPDLPRGTTILGNISDYVQSVDCYFNKVRIVKNSWDRGTVYVSYNMGKYRIRRIEKCSLSTNGGFANASSQYPTPDPNGYRLLLIIQLVTITIQYGLLKT